MSIGINTNATNVIADVTLIEAQTSAISVKANDPDIADLESSRSNSSVKANESILTTSYLAAQLNAQLNAQTFAPTLESQAGVYNVSVKATDDPGLSTINNQTSTSSPNSNNQTGGNTNPIYADPDTSGSNPFNNNGGDYVPLNTLSTPSTVATSSPTATIANNPLYSSLVSSNASSIDDSGVLRHSSIPDQPNSTTPNPIE